MAYSHLLRCHGYQESEIRGEDRRNSKSLKEEEK